MRAGRGMRCWRRTGGSWLLHEPWRKESKRGAKPGCGSPRTSPTTLGIPLLLVLLALIRQQRRWAGEQEALYLDGACEPRTKELTGGNVFIITVRGVPACISSTSSLLLNN